MMVLMLLPVQTIQASVWNNAYTYYNTYGNSVIFSTDINHRRKYLLCHKGCNCYKQYTISDDRMESDG